MKRDYNDPVYKEWRTRIFKRDKFKCQMPSCDRKTRLNAHHIVKWSSAPHLRYDEYNGITLCQYCHKQVTNHEHMYESLFMDIVRSNDAKS